jgi:hypothetical protein
MNLARDSTFAALALHHVGALIVACLPFEVRHDTGLQMEEV